MGRGTYPREPHPYWPLEPRSWPLAPRQLRVPHTVVDGLAGMHFSLSTSVCNALEALAMLTFYFMPTLHYKK